MRAQDLLKEVDIIQGENGSKDLGEKVAGARDPGLGGGRHWRS